MRTRSKQRTTNNHYVNNADFLAALVKYRDECEQAKKNSTQEPKIPDYIGECFLKIAEHLSRKPNFISYTYRDEMISDGVENCLMYFRNFDPAKSKNPFAYFTQIIYYAFLRRIMREKKQLYVKYKATQQFGLLDEGSKVPLIMAYHHGYGGGGPVTKDVIQTNRRAVYLPDANIVISGHTHDRWIVPVTRNRISHIGIVVGLIDDKTCMTFEGNTSGSGDQRNGGMVMIKVRSFGNAISLFRNTSNPITTFVVISIVFWVW